MNRKTSYAAPMDKQLVDKFLESAKSGNLDIVKECIHNGVGKESKDKHGQTALHFASENGHIDIVKYLIETCRVKKDKRDKYFFRTPMLCASFNGHLTIVRYFIETCHVDIGAQDKHGYNAFSLACLGSHLKLIQYFVETWDVNAGMKLNVYGTTALHIASENGDLEILQYFIEVCHIDKEIKDHSKTTALHVAMKQGHMEIVEYLNAGSTDIASTTPTLITNRNNSLYDSLNNTTKIESVSDKMTSPETYHPLSIDPVVTTSTWNPTIAAPNVDVLPLEYKTMDDLPWYTIVIDSHQDSTINATCNETGTYQNIRNSNSKYIPLEILYYKLILHFQQPKYIKTYREIPSQEDQLLFVYMDKKESGEIVFRPIDRKEIITGKTKENEAKKKYLSSRDARDFHVRADIRNNGGRRQLRVEEKIKHLRLLIQLKRQALNAMVSQSPFKQLMTNMLESIESLINNDTTENNVQRHYDQISDTWERYFPSSDNNKKRKR